MRLKEKVAIITGGANGIGKAFCLGFAKEGAKLILADIDINAASSLVKTLKAQGTDAIAIKTDISTIKDVQEMVNKTLEKFGRIDILVNNAAMASRAPLSRFPLHKVSVEEWDRILSVNLKGAFLCCKFVIPHMMKQMCGKIINIASSLAFGPIPNMVPYITSKGGIVGMTRALAREAGDYNINVNAIAPGSTLAEEPTEKAIAFRSLEIQIRSIKRMEYPEDLVGTALFLASSDSDFITGQTIEVDGGLIMK